MSNDLVLPQPGEPLVNPERRITALWFGKLREIASMINNPVDPPYTVATLPTSAQLGARAYVTNATGGAVPAFWDGTNWRRVTDRTIVN